MKVAKTKIGIVGAGLIGGKRAVSICHTRQGRLVAVADTEPVAAHAFATRYNITAMSTWQELVSRSDVDAVVVAVPNAYAAEIVLAALRSGKHVLCEKPFGISTAESIKMHNAAVKAGKVVKVGFNHRFHAAILKAYELLQKGAIGDVLFVRARYGHGGRSGMEKEWRFISSVSGGGELLDQGVHVIDLASWFAGNFKTAYGLAQTKFWNTKVDDNAFALLKSEKVTLEFHVSTTNWKNIFSFEVFGSLGYLQIDGKGGSYGDETLIYGKRAPGFGVPTLKRYAFPAGDSSWNREWRNFFGAIQGRNAVCGDSRDGAYANQVVEALYKSSATHREVAIPPLNHLK